jgi:dipeptidyl aminopeptidase/acylaminoacyl peptidase
LQEIPTTSYEILSADWLDSDTYRVEAVLQPGHRLISLDIRQPVNRWQVADIQPAVATPPAPAPIEAVAPAAQPAGQGQLVFQTVSGGDICLINADGTGLRRLTQGIDPELSPDGRQVAFTRWGEAGGGTVYVWDLASDSERAVLSESRLAKSPTWSPDGQKIIVSFQQGKQQDFSEEECDTFDWDDNIHVRAVGGRIEFERYEIGPGGLSLCYMLRPDTHWRLRQVDVATGQFQDIPSDQYSYGPSWHPVNLDQWLYKGEQGLILYDGRTGQAQPITQDFQDHSPVISPDGSRIAVSYRQHDHWEIHAMNIDGSNRQRLTETPLTYLARRDLIVKKEVDGAMRFVPTENQQWNNAAPAWSPDGHSIAFLTDRSGWWEIWVINADGSNQRPMFPGGVLDQLTFSYTGVDERMLSWRIAPSAQ